MPEAYGGLGGGPVETMIVMEEFGKALVVEPYVQTVVVGGGFFNHGGTRRAEGRMAGQDRGRRNASSPSPSPSRKGRYNFADLTTTAKKSGRGYVLNGQKARRARRAHGPTRLIVTARTAGGQRDAKGVSVFLVDKKAKGVVTRDYPTVDGLRASEVTFENVGSRPRLIGHRG